jgi:hypothetical protein
VIAVGVVLLISFLALGLSAGVIVALSVPLTLAITFMAMDASGMQFQRITLGSLILALGLLVDDAIIAIEMMLVKMEEGMDRVAAATFAWTSTAFPMLTGTLVTVAASCRWALPPRRPGSTRAASSESCSSRFSRPGSWRWCSPLSGVKLLPRSLETRLQRRDATTPTTRRASSLPPRGAGAWLRGPMDGDRADARGVWRSGPRRSRRCPSSSSRPPSGPSS